MERDAAAARPVTPWYFLPGRTIDRLRRRSLVRSNGTAAGVAHHQRARQTHDAFPVVLAIDTLEQAQPRLASEFVEVHVHGGQRRTGGGGNDFPVVKTHHGDIAGNPDTAVAQRVDGAARDLVAAAE